MTSVYHTNITVLLRTYHNYFSRLRRRRAPQKYGLLSHMEDQEMFPLAADDGDDEEIYNATDHHHTLK